MRIAQSLSTILLAALCLPLTATIAQSTAVPSAGSSVVPVGGSTGACTITYSEDFTGNAIDRGNVSNVFGGDGGQYDHVWDQDQCTVSDGNLVLGAEKEADGRYHVCGILTNAGGFSQQYGHFEFRVAVPPGQGIWPAVLLWPSNNQWPPEYDLVEMPTADRQQLYSTHHDGPANNQVHSVTELDGTQFNVYSIDVTPTKVTYYINGTAVLAVTDPGMLTQVDVPMSLGVSWYVSRDCQGWTGCPDATTPQRMEMLLDYMSASTLPPGYVPPDEGGQSVCGIQGAPGAAPGGGYRGPPIVVPPPPPPPPPPPNSAECDFEAIKQSLYGTESASAGGYTARGPNTQYGVPLGKYQMIPPTQAALISRHPECNGSACQGEAILQPQCHPVQECLMDRLLAENLDRVRNDAQCQALIGQTVTGSGQGRTLSCSVTESGLLAAMHLGGAGVCRRMQPGGTGPSDNLGTSTAYYTCRHGQTSIPGQCQPSPYDPATNPPTLTTEQLANTPPGQVSVFGDALKDLWIASLQLMAEQFTINMALQVEMIGKMLDAKHQLETQRMFQQRSAEAHKDYQPSDQMCTFGTFSRDLLASERTSDVTKLAISNEILQRETGSGDSKAKTNSSDAISRIAQFRTRFCNPQDNGRGLAVFCPSPGPANMRNKDINYTQTIDQPLTLNIDLADTGVSADEESVFALVDNLFLHDTMPRIPADPLKTRKFEYHYMNMRSIIAMRGIARNTVANVVAMKTSSPNRDNNTNAPFLRALLREFGLTDDEIRAQLGENPSYYAQMELLTKKIYQNPTFYTNLYDKPANVQRIRAAMKAIKLMQDRDIQASLQRREMLLSMMLELRLRERANEVYNATEEAMFEMQ